MGTALVCKMFFAKSTKCDKSYPTGKTIQVYYRLLLGCDPVFLPQPEVTLTIDQWRQSRPTLETPYQIGSISGKGGYSWT